MLRGMRLALLCLVTIAAPAHANSGAHTAGAAQVSASLTAPPSLWGGTAGAAGREAAAHPGVLASLPRPHEREGSVGFPWLKPGRSGVAVALTEQFRVGLGYRYLEGEDLWPEFADTGAADYGSHHLLIRASWRF